jgi:hypothetical protein
VQTCKASIALIVRGVQLALLLLLILSLGAAIRYPGFLTGELPGWLLPLRDYSPHLSFPLYSLFHIATAGLLIALLVWLIISPASRHRLGLDGVGLVPELVRAAHWLALLFLVIGLGSGLVVIGQRAISPGVLPFVLQTHLWALMAAVAVAPFAWVLSIILGRRGHAANTELSRETTGACLNKLLIALAAGGVIALGLHWYTTRPLELSCHASGNRPVIDGVARPFEWSRADSVSLTLWGGAGFSGGATRAVLRVLRVNQQIYFLIQWDDPTRSLNRYLIKTDPHRWVELRADQTHREPSEFWEDQLMLIVSPEHAQRIRRLPSTRDAIAGREPADTLDVWRWMAVSTNPTGQADDCWYGTDSSGVWGLHPDPRTGGGATSNYNHDWQQPFLMNSGPQVVPWIDVDSRFVTPYWPSVDTLEVGTLVPSVIVGAMAGDGADVRAAGRHYDGTWTVELVRHINTGSPFDVSCNRSFRLDILIADDSRSGFCRSLRAVEVSIPD